MVTTTYISPLSVRVLSVCTSSSFPWRRSTLRWSPERCPSLSNRTRPHWAFQVAWGLTPSGLALIRAFASSKPSLPAARSPPCCSTHCMLGGNRICDWGPIMVPPEGCPYIGGGASSPKRGFPLMGATAQRLTTCKACRQFLLLRSHSREPKGCAIGVCSYHRTFHGPCIHVWWLTSRWWDLVRKAACF